MAQEVRCDLEMMVGDRGCLFRMAGRDVNVLSLGEVRNATVRSEMLTVVLSRPAVRVVSVSGDCFGYVASATHRGP